MRDAEFWRRGRRQSIEFAGIGSGLVRLEGGEVIFPEMSQRTDRSTQASSRFEFMRPLKFSFACISRDPTLFFLPVRDLYLLCPA
jgi:hypothetical protein